MARVSHIPNEKKDEKAGSFWSNLASSLGFKKPMLKTASANQKPAQLTAGIQTHGKQDLKAGVHIPLFARSINAISEADVNDGLKRTSLTIDAMKALTAVDIYSDDKIGTTEEFARTTGAVEHAKAALEASAGASGTDMSGHQEKMAAVEAAISGLSGALIRSVPTYKTTLDQIQSNLNQYQTMLQEAAPAGMGMETEGTMGAFDSMTPSEPMAAAASEDSEAIGLKLAQAYNSLSFAYSLSAHLSAQAEAAGVSEAVPMGLAALRAPGIQKKAGAEFKGTMDKFAASGDPGDRDDTTNLIYTDINRCRDCVWFESDWTHETYRDKCKNCVHAKLGGTVDHWWPRFSQMTMWMPSWNEPQAERKAFQGSLSVLDSSRHAPLDFEVIAQEVSDRVPEPNATRLATVFMEVFNQPILKDRLARLGGKVAQKVAELTGIEFVITRPHAEAWGHNGFGKMAQTEVLAACPRTLQDEMKDEKDRKEKRAAMENNPKCTNKDCQCGPACDPGKECPGSMHKKEAGLSHEAKGERAKIRRLRQKLDQTDNPTKIREFSDAIDALENRLDKDKERKDQRKKDRDEKQKAKDEAATADTEAYAGDFRGTLSVVAKAPYKDSPADVPGAGDNISKKKGKPITERLGSFDGTLSLAGAKERTNKKPKNYGNVKPSKPEKALSKKAEFEGSLSLRGSL